MAEIIWSHAARRHMREIHDFIAQDSDRAASGMLDRIESAVRNLAIFPMSGRRLREARNLGFREVIVRPYRVIYRYDAASDTVFVSAIIHGRRRLPTLDA